MNEPETTAEAADDAIIRPYEPRDRGAVRRICFETGFMGESVRDQYGDAETFADLLTAYFTDEEPEHAVVAVARGDVIGYSLSTLDARLASRAMSRALLSAVARGACFRRDTVGFWLRSVRDVLTDLRPERPAIDWDRFPSTSHVNILPGWRGGTVGRDLMYSAFDRLARAGAPGIHGKTFSANQRTLKFWKKTLGLTVPERSRAVPGFRTREGGRLHHVIGYRTFHDWQVGAWKAGI